VCGGGANDLPCKISKVALALKVTQTEGWRPLLKSKKCYVILIYVRPFRVLCFVWFLSAAISLHNLLPFALVPCTGCIGQRRESGWLKEYWGRVHIASVTGDSLVGRECCTVTRPLLRCATTRHKITNANMRADF